MIHSGWLGGGETPAFTASGNVCWIAIDYTLQQLDSVIACSLHGHYMIRPRGLVQL